MNETREIDLKKMLKALLKRAWIIVLCAVLIGVGTLVYTANFVTPMYTASVTMYVNNNNNTTGYPGVVSSSNLAVALQLVKTYVNIIQSDTVLDKVIEEAGVQLTPGQIRGMMSAEAVNETEMFRVTINSPSAELSVAIADTIADVAPAEISAIIEGSSAKVVDYARVPNSPSSPNVMRNTILGTLVGALLAVLAIVMSQMLDVRIKDETDLQAICDIPVLGRIPDLAMIAPSVEKKGKR